MSTWRPDRLPVAPGSAGILARIASLPSRRKKRRKKRGGEITPIRTRRKFVLRSAGNPGRLRSARRPQTAQPAFLPTWGSEVRAPHETRNTNHGLYGRSVRRGCERGRTTKNRRPDRRARRQVTASLRAFARHCAAILLPSHCFPVHYLFTIVRYCSVLFGGWGGCP